MSGLPTLRMSPMAGLANAMRRLVNRRYRRRETELRQQIAAARQRRAQIDNRMRTETNGGRRTAWRMLRDDSDLEGL